jgi:zona occludens toxin (predicted ATPase)
MEKQTTHQIINCLAIKRKEFVNISGHQLRDLMDELETNYPNAKIKFFGLGNRFNVIRYSSAKTLTNK